MHNIDKCISAQQICNQEIISPSSSSDKSFDENFFNLKCKKVNEDIDDFKFNNSLNDRLNLKFSSNDSIAKYGISGKIRKINSRSPQNINNLTNDENKNLLQRGSVDVALNLNSNESSISLQELLNINANQSQQKLLMNGSCSTLGINQNSYATADNMPLKLRFKMLQLKTGEVN